MTDSEFMKTLRMSAKTSTLVDGKSDVRMGRGTEVSKHTNNSTIVPRLITRRPIKIGMKNLGGGSFMFIGFTF